MSLSSLLSKVIGAPPPPAPTPAPAIADAEFGMTVPNEQTFCRHYARDHFTGVGEIADLGCWMGATTISFSKGLRKNPKLTPDQKKKRIHSYDLFLWHPSMEQNVKGTPLEGKYQEGDSFLPDFEARTAKWHEQFTIYAGDLNEHPWTAGPIEMLFVDAMKWPDTASSILKKFYPHLIPGTSVVAHQDFAHFWTGWIHLIQYRLRDYFVLHKDVDRSCTVAFKLIKEIPPALLEQDCFLQNADLAEIEAAFDYSASLVCADKQEQILAARAMSHVHRGELEIADQLATDFMWKNVRQYLFRDQMPELIAVKNELEQRRK